jgi:phospholipid/cholesterol/gamma-HCH transport system substrate-binding protein
VSKGIWKNIRLILFLVGTLGGLIFLYLLVNKVDFGGGQLYTVQFDYIGSINIGSPVRKSGVKVGSVSDIEINPADQKTVFATLLLRSDQTVRAGDRFAIVSGGILGDQFVEIFPGDLNEALLPPGTLIVGEKALDLNGLAVEGGTMLKELSSASKVLNRVLVGNEERLGVILENVEIITEDLVVFTDSARQIGELIPILTAEIQDSAAQINQSIADFTLQGSNLLASMEAQVSKNQGNLRSTMQNIEGVSNELLDLTQALNKENSVIQLLGDPEVSDDLRVTLSNLRSVTEDIKNLTKDLIGGDEPTNTGEEGEPSPSPQP